MIRVPTTFVVGAGASCKQGYPLGPSLLRLVRDFDEYDFGLLHQATGAGLAVSEFMHAIRNYPGQSLDALLRNQPKLSKVGKAAIAIAFARAERDRRKRFASAVEKPSPWLRRILGAMARDLDSPAEFAEKNKHVRFVTFNFDNLIENTAPGYILEHFSPDAPRPPHTEPLVNVDHVHGSLQPHIVFDSNWIVSTAS